MTPGFSVGAARTFTKNVCAKFRKSGGRTGLSEEGLVLDVLN